MPSILLPPQSFTNQGVSKKLVKDKGREGNKTKATNNREQRSLDIIWNIHQMRL